MSANGRDFSAASVATGSTRSLPLSVIATASVAVLPTFIAFALLVFSQPDPHVLVAVIASLVFTAGAAAGGAALWARQPESAGVAFGDLMLWSWVRHRSADRTLERAAAALGYDRSGRPVGGPEASRDESVDAMRAIARALDAKSTYTLGHSRRVAEHAEGMARELNLSEEDTDALVLAATLHDVGNIGLSDAILRKAGDLSIEERSQIEAHVLLGARIVERAGKEQVTEGIRHHHEHWKGDGYPDGLSELEIPLFARVIAIAEAFDAMTSTRPYRHSIGTREAATILRSEAGSQFDPDLVETFVSTIRAPRSFLKAVPFLGTIQGHLRELSLVFKRIGAVAVSGIASTIAIALILGSTALSPGVAPDETSVDLAKRRGPVDGDRVLGEIVSDDEEDGGSGEAGSIPMSSREGAADGEPMGSDVPEKKRTSDEVRGRVITFDPGRPDGGSDPGTPPPSDGGGSSEPEPDPEPTPTETAPPPPSEEPKEPEGDEKDKNPDANGNGNAHGHDKDKGEKP